MVTHSVYSRRGAALLIVLGVLVLTIGALTTLVRLATTVAIERETGHAIAIADDLILQIDGPINAWLEGADEVVLPPDVVAPVTHAFTHSWQNDGVSVRVDVTAIDQCGLIPLSARAGTTLRSTLPGDIAAVIAGWQPPRNVPLGIDLMRPRMPRSGEIPLFPAMTTGPVTSFGESADTTADDEVDAAETEMALAIGSVLATHNEGPRININTAPAALLQAAMRDARLGGTESILAARSAGRAPALPQAPSVPGRRGARIRRQPTARGLAIVSGSNAWAFRVDIEVDTISRSWWCVYQRESGRGSGGGSWRCVQRLVIVP